MFILNSTFFFCLSVLVANKESISKQLNDNERKGATQRKRKKILLWIIWKMWIKKKPLLHTITAAEEKSKQTNVHNSIENQRIKSVPENAKM